ncbi:ABC transporter permease subunit [Enterococcus bulliens]
MRKKIWIPLVLVLFAIVGFTSQAHADEQTSSDEFRVGMEAAYAPFNWTQTSPGPHTVELSKQKYVGGYDVSIAQIIADKLGKKLVVVPTQWDGLVPALQSGKIDAIIAGMSPTEERRKQIDFTDPYYESQFVVIVQKDGKYGKAKSLSDLEGAKITAQLNTLHYDLIDQIPGVKKQQAQKDFSAMRVALASGVIDGYVSERPEGITATNVNKKLTMLEFPEGQGFKAAAEDVQTAIGLRKGDPDAAKINEILSTISSEERTKLMDQAVKEQPTATEDEQTGLLGTFKQIIQQYWKLFLSGAALTLFIAIFSTIAGTLIGLLVGVFRTLPNSENPVARFFQKAFNWFLSIYIEVFRGTPMMVQAMVIFYGLALAFQIDLNRTVAALLIVSVNTGAYMSEIVRGGIFAVDKGQFEAAQAIGMNHRQTMVKVVLPQVLRNILPAIGNETVINIKDTAVLSVISVTDLFFAGSVASGTNLQFFPTFTIIGIIYLIMTISATKLLRLFEKRIDGPDSYIKMDDVLEGQEK